MGILGRVSAYFGLVESQGCGTLHLHILLWLVNVPTADEMAVLLQDPAFRECIIAYIQANLWSYLSGLESADSIQSIPIEKDVTYSRPPNPESNNYELLLARDELHLARTEQLHTCKPRRCLFVDKSGWICCKRQAPFPCSNEDFV